MLLFGHDLAPVRGEFLPLPPSSVAARLGRRLEAYPVRTGSVSRYRSLMNQHRPQAATRGFTVPSATVLCVQSGQIEFQSGAHCVGAGRGQALLVSGACRMRTTIRSAEVEVIAVTIPHAELSEDIKRHLSANSLEQIGSPFADCLRMLAQWVDLGSQQEALSLYDAVRAMLLAQAKQAQARSCGQARKLNARLLARIEAHIGENLRDPDLSPGRVAGSFGISPRYLHKLFSARGETFGAYVMSRRLEGVGDDLTGADHPPTAIWEIAVRWGFGDISSFNRAFKARYGCTPTQFRDIGS